MIEEIVINNRDNTIDLLLKADGEAEDLAIVEKMVLIDEAGNIDDISSEDHPSWFDWDEDVVGKVKIKLGEAELEAGKRYIFRLVVFDAVNTNGIFWDRFMVKVN